MMLELAIAPSLDYLAYVTDRLEDSLMREGLGAERIGHVRLIVEELGCNALTHGQPAEQPLRLQLKLDPQALVLELHDPGKAFDPRAIRLPDLAAEFDQRPIGGLGLFWCISSPITSTTAAMVHTTWCASLFFIRTPLSPRPCHDHARHPDRPAERHPSTRHPDRAAGHPPTRTWTRRCCHCWAPTSPPWCWI